MKINNLKITDTKKVKLLTKVCNAYDVKAHDYRGYFVCPFGRIGDPSTLYMFGKPDGSDFDFAIDLADAWDKINTGRRTNDK